MRLKPHETGWRQPTLFPIDNSIGVGKRAQFVEVKSTLGRFSSEEK